MIYNIYAIRDVKTGFLTPTVDMNDDSAIRNFGHACQNTDSLFFTYPEDYALYEIGTYDTENGTIVPTLPNVLAQATDFKKGN